MDDHKYREASARTPALVQDTQSLFTGAEGSYFVTKEKTVGCEEAAQERRWIGDRGFEQGVLLPVEIKTTLFLAHVNGNKPLFIAVHTPADKDVAPASVIKQEVHKHTGIAIAGKLDRVGALSELNFRIKPILKNYQRIDTASFEVLRHYKVHNPRYGFLRKVMKIHSMNPNLQQGMVNPWTLVRLVERSCDPAWAAQGVEPLEMVQLIDRSLAERKEMSTTNAGSWFWSMILPRTDVAFARLQELMKMLDSEKHFVISDAVAVPARTRSARAVGGEQSL